MSKLTDNLDANFKLFIEEVRESGQVWGLRYGEDWVVCRSAEFEDADVMPLWSAEVDARLHCVDEWADYEPEVIELEEFLDIWINDLNEDDVLIGRTGTPIWKARSSSPSSWPRRWLNWTPEQFCIDGWPVTRPPAATKNRYPQGCRFFLWPSATMMD